MNKTELNTIKGIMKKVDYNMRLLRMMISNMEVEDKDLTAKDMELFNKITSYGEDGIEQRKFIQNKTGYVSNIKRLERAGKIESAFVESGKKGRPVKFIRAYNLCVDL